MQQSSAEAAQAENAEKTRRLKEKRLAAFAAGLEKLPTLGIEEVKSTPSEEQYNKDCHAELRRIMKEAK
jgi:hypothetical protein